MPLNGMELPQVDLVWLPQWSLEGTTTLSPACQALTHIGQHRVKYALSSHLIDGGEMGSANFHAGTLDLNLTSMPLNFFSWASNYDMVRLSVKISYKLDSHLKFSHNILINIVPLIHQWTICSDMANIWYKEHATICSPVPNDDRALIGSLRSRDISVPSLGLSSGDELTRLTLLIHRIKDQVLTN